MVQELMDLNETDILDKLFSMTKLISDDNKNMENVQKYVESKLFNSDGESKFFLIENPYINTDDKLNSVGSPNFFAKIKNFEFKQIASLMILMSFLVF